MVVAMKVTRGEQGFGIEPKYVEEPGCGKLPHSVEPTDIERKSDEVIGIEIDQRCATEREEGCDKERGCGKEKEN